jgi:hypothetical protein
MLLLLTYKKIYPFWVHRNSIQRTTDFQLRFSHVSAQNKNASKLKHIIDAVKQGKQNTQVAEVCQE